MYLLIQIELHLEMKLHYPLFLINILNKMGSAVFSFVGPLFPKDICVRILSLM